ncbi:hypothetical protein ACLIJR_13515 [Hydrogenophaga sp. XSHU_21]
MAMTFVAHAFRRLVIESAVVQRWLRCGLAALFAGLGVKLGLSERWPCAERARCKVGAHGVLRGSSE